MRITHQFINVSKKHLNAVLPKHYLLMKKKTNTRILHHTINEQHLMTFFCEEDHHEKSISSSMQQATGCIRKSKRKNKNSIYKNFTKQTFPLINFEFQIRTQQVLRSDRYLTKWSQIKKF